MNPLGHFLSPQFIRCTLLGISLGLLAGAAPAQSGQSGPPDQKGGDHPHGPPREAIAACANKAAGAACSFVGRRGEQLAGACFVPPPHPASVPDGNNGYGAKGGAREKMPMACRPPRQDQ
ncbi:MAG TPA: hypothetical protein VIF60_02015 [Burkholderiaceae bacterium]|jgi:hypothetical protein